MCQFEGAMLATQFIFLFCSTEKGVLREEELSLLIGS